MASEDANSPAAVAEEVSVDLPAPEGWKKKFMPKKGGTPRRNEITFISPTGEEITNKRQLDQYLRAHPGGPPSSEFDWGTGDTPRRSSRLSAKAKAIESPEGEKPKKRERKSSGKKGTKDDKDSEEKNDASEAADEAKESAFAKMKDSDVSIDMTEAGGEAEKASKEKTNENVEDNVHQEKENSKILPKDSEDGENKVFEAAKDAAAADETKGSEDIEMMSNEGKTENELGEKTNEAVKDAAAADETKGSEDVEMMSNEGKAENELGEKTNENIDARNVGHLANESSEKADQELGEEGSKNAEKEKPESFELFKEEASGKGEKDGDAPTQNDSFKENRDKDTPTETQYPVNYDDEKHQPKASPVNC